MDLRQLNYLVTLSEEKHFARAADVCCVTQPTLSSRIRQLEDEFGVPLVVRDQRYRGLTRFGERVVDWAKNVLADCDALKHDFSRISQAGEGSISVGIVTSASPLASLLLSFLRLQDVPVTTDVQTLDADEITRRVADGNLDIGITYAPSVAGLDVDVFPLTTESYVALSYDEVGERLPETMTWAELNGRDLCLPSQNVPARSSIEDCLSKSCAKWHPAIETDCWLTMLQAVRRNGLIGVAPSHVIGILTIPLGTSISPLPQASEPLELALLTSSTAANEIILEKVVATLPRFTDFFMSEAAAFTPME